MLTQLSGDCSAVGNITALSQSAETVAELSMSKAGVQLPGASFLSPAHTVGYSVAFISHMTRLRYIYCFENLHYPRHESPAPVCGLCAKDATRWQHVTGLK